MLDATMYWRQKDILNVCLCIRIYMKLQVHASMYRMHIKYKKKTQFVGSIVKMQI